MMNSKDSLEFMVSLTSGGIAGIISKSFAAPVERVKLLLQTQKVNEQLKNASVNYEGPVDCIKKVYRSQGLLSFWRGNTAAVIRYLPNQSLNFAFKDLFKKYLVPKNATTNDRSFYIANMLSGGLAGISALSLLYPLDLVRTRLAADIGSSSSNKLSPSPSVCSSPSSSSSSSSFSSSSSIILDKKYSGTIDCLKKTYQSSGFKGLFAGYGTSLFSVFIYRGLYFGGYDIIKELLKSNDVKSNVFISYITAQLHTTIVGTLCYPLDTIKRRMMMPADKKGSKYSSGFGCFRNILKEEGIRGLFSGLSVNLFRGVFGAVLLVLYDEIKLYLTVD